MVASATGAEVTPADPRIAQMVVLFWGQLSEMIGQEFLGRLGVTSANMKERIGTGVLDSHQDYVHEFLGLYHESGLNVRVSSFVTDVCTLAQQAAKNVDAKGGAA